MRSIATLMLALSTLPLTAASGRSHAASDRHQDVLNSIATFKRKDPGIQRFFDGAVGYAVLPKVGKGAIGIGGAHGTGEVLVGGKAIGKVSMTQVTIGFQLGGQAYSEIIFFQKPSALDALEHGHFAFAAQATAVALASGASANAAYRDGVAVFTTVKGGLMYEASVGGQKFSFKAY